MGVWREIENNAGRREEREYIVEVSEENMKGVREECKYERGREEGRDERGYIYERGKEERREERGCRYERG